MILGICLSKKVAKMLPKKVAKILTEQVANWWPICLPKSKAKAKTTLLRRLVVQFLTNVWPICLTNLDKFVDQILTIFFDYFSTFFEIMQKSAENVIKCGI